MSKSQEEQSSADFWGTVIGVVILVGIAVEFVSHHVVYFVGLLAVAAAAVGTYVYRTSDRFKLKVAWREAKQEYDRLRVQNTAVTRCPPEKIRYLAKTLLEQDGIDVSQPSAQWFISAVDDIYRRDYQGEPFPLFPSLATARDRWHMGEVVEDARRIVTYAEGEVERADLTMDLVRRVAADLWAFADNLDHRGPVLVRLFDIVPDIRDMVTAMSAYFFLPKYWDCGVGESVREAFQRNVQNASLAAKTEREIERSGRVFPGEFKGTADEVLDAYLGDTPFVELFTAVTSLSFRQSLRYEHGVIVAGTGGGKTQLLEALVLADLDCDDPPGVIVIDSKGEMVERIARLDIFHPDHGRLKDRLIIIKHTDKPALNLFDVDRDTVEHPFNQIESLMKYFFGSLFDSKTSDQMDTLLIPLLHIVLRKDGATLRTLLELVENPRAYPEMLDQIPRDSKDFILNQFNKPFYALTKSAIITRLSRLTQDESLGAMFTTPRNAVDLARALNDGKIILVNTDAEGLVDRSPTFGRYFIAQAYHAGLSRGSRQGEKRRPIHVYIDECAPYLDDKIEKLLTTIRSYGVGVVMAFQGQWQMAGYERVIQGNTAIKILGHLKDDVDARMFAGNMRTNVEFLMSQRKDPSEPPQYGDFGCYTTELNRTVAIRVPFYQLDRRKQMSDAAYLRLMEGNRDRVTQGQPEDAFRATLKQHFSAIGPLWGELEEAAKACGAKNELGDLDIDRLAGRLSPEQRQTFHSLRRQRNRLTHPDRVTGRQAPVPDLRWWVTQAHALLAILSKNKPDDSTATTSDF